MLYYPRGILFKKFSSWIFFVTEVIQMSINRNQDQNNRYFDEEEQKAIEEFFRQMAIAEESILTEGTVTDEELRKSLGI